MFDKRSKILTLIDQGILAPEEAEAAMETAGVYPDEASWHRFIGQLLLWLGLLSTVLGVVFFVAFNWDALGKFGKFALVEGVLILSTLPLLRVDLHSRIGQFSLLGAGIILGALLALFGQVYQTGADTWQLFATWAVLLLPWAVLGRFEPLWLLWIGIVDLAIGLYFSLFGFTSFHTVPTTMLAMLIVNATALGIWEWYRHSESTTHRAGARLIATIAGVSATRLGVSALVDNDPACDIWGLVYLLWFGLHCWIYRRHIHDLFMLAGACLSGMVILMVFLGKNFISLHFWGGGFLILAIALIVAGAGATQWLRATARTWEEEDDE